MKESLNYLNLPVPTPTQLENSIAALTPGDARIKRYEMMIPKAAERYDAWLKRNEEIRQATRFLKTPRKAS